MSLLKIFICYRRQDSIHAAQRLRAFLQRQFGDEAVFIDQEIPPGANWPQLLDERLQGCSDVIVLVGDDFLRRLRRKARGSNGDDPDDVLVMEIATAIRLKRAIYPLLIGALDMPAAAQLPEPIKALASYQATFAREPAFDAALAVLADALRSSHGLGAAVESSPQGAGAAAARSAPVSVVATLASGVAFVLAVCVAAWACGAAISMQAGLPSHPQHGAVLDAWRGLRYLLLTLLLGLGPYAAYWLVSMLRARFRLPIRNASGWLAVFNVGAALVCGGAFLVLSTQPGWRFRPALGFPEQPSLLHYGLLAVAGCALLFGYSLWHSQPAAAPVDPVAQLGYLLLCPTASLLYAYGWKFAGAQLQLRERGFEFGALFALVAALLVVATLALYAVGVAPMFAPL